MKILIWANSIYQLDNRPRHQYLIMEFKKLIWVGMFVGTTAGSLIPTLWSAGIFSMSSTILSAIGGFAGIYIAYRLSR